MFFSNPFSRRNACKPSLKDWDGCETAKLFKVSFISYPLIPETNIFLNIWDTIGYFALYMWRQASYNDEYFVITFKSDSIRYPNSEIIRSCCENIRYGSVKIIYWHIVKIVKNIISFKKLFSDGKYNGISVEGIKDKIIDFKI